MKFFLTIGFLLIACLSFSQSDLEKALNSAEEELNRLQNIKTEMIRSLSAEGKNPAQDISYLRLQEQLDVQLEKTKTLRKQYKKEKKAQKKADRQAVENQAGIPTPIGNSTSSPAPGNVNQDAAKIRKQEIKFLKQEIKLLKKEQKELMKQVEATGQLPASSPQVQEFDRKILARQEELLQMQTAPLPVNTSVSQPPSPIVNQTPITTAPVPVVTTPQPEAVTEQPIFTSEPELINQEIPIQELPVIGLSTILFEKFSTEVKEDYSLYLNHVAKQLQENPAVNLEISSFTDNSEKNRVSMQITAGMANSVAQEMVNRGISPERLKVKANGSKKAVADNNNFFGQARNRRVELKFFY